MSQLFPEEEIPKQEEQEPPMVEQAEVSQYFETGQTEETHAANEPENAAEKQQGEDIVKPIEYDRNTLEGMIQSEKEILDVMRDYWIKSQPYTYVKHSMMLKAYELFLQTHEGKIT